MPALAGKLVVVFGGANGIGAAVVDQSAAAGARIVVADLDVEAGRKAAAAVGGRFVECDAADAEQVAAALDGPDRIDGVVTTVGGAHVAAVGDVGTVAFATEIAFNLTSAFVVGQAALGRLASGGALVLFGSGYAHLPAPDRAGYAAAKAGVASLTRTFATVGAPDGIRVNCVAPGPTDTPRFRAMNGGDAGAESVRRGMPLGRIPMPADLAAPTVFLLGAGAQAITGQVLHVNGGLVIP